MRLSFPFLRASLLLACAAASAPEACADIDGPNADSVWAAQLKSDLYGPNAAEIAELGPTRIDNALSLHRGLSPGISAGAALQAEAKPFQARKLDWKDPFLFARDRRWIDRGALTSSAQVRIYPGISRASRDAHQLLALRWVTDSIYRLEGTRLRAAFNAYVHLPVYGGVPGSNRNLRSFLSPRLEYRLSPSFRALFLLKSWVSHERGAQALEWRTDLAICQVAGAWEAAPELLVMPSLELDRRQAVSWNALTLGATVAWRIL